jgi:hypothetical protein
MTIQVNNMYLQPSLIKIELCTLYLSPSQNKCISHTLRSRTFSSLTRFLEDNTNIYIFK